MNEIFIDTAYWVALLLPNDLLHDAALAFADHTPPNARFITSELVLVELLNHVCGLSPAERMEAAEIWSDVLRNPSFTIVPASDDLFRRARRLYEQFSDKKWSLTDCASIVIMHDRNLTDALTHDHHFEQAGFRALLRS